MFKTFCAAAVAAAALFAAPVAAAPVTYILTTGPARGTLDGQPFLAETVAFTITTNSESIFDEAVNEDERAFFSDGATVSLDRNVYDMVGRIGLYEGPGAFGMWRTPGGNLLDSRGTTIDLEENIGPIHVTFRYLQWTSFFNPGVTTNAGVLVFDNQDVEGTYESIVDEMPPIPLPAAGWLLLAGLGGLGLMRRR